MTTTQTPPPPENAPVALHGVVPVTYAAVPPGADPRYASGAVAPSPRGALFWFAMASIVVITVCGVGVGAFLVGQGTRPSDGEVAERLSTQAAQDRTVFTGELDTALTTQRTDLKRLMRRRVRNASESAFTEGQSQGYSSGQTAGYSSGHQQGQEEGKEEGREAGKEEGREEGLIDGYGQGFEEGTCYDPVTYEYVC